MNFKGFLRLSLLSLSIAATASCTSEPLPDISVPTTYTGKKLRINYCGEEMPAKKVTATSEAADHVTLIAEGTTDLSLLSSLGFNGTGPAPGVLPGTSQLTLPVPLMESGSKYKFEGSGSNDFCESFTYSGFLEGDSLILNLDKVVLSNDYLSGTVWAPIPFKQSGLQIESTPFHLIWEVDPIAEIDLDLTGLLKGLVNIPNIPTYQHTAYSSIAQLLSMALQTVAFNQNGNIFVRYFSSVGGATQLMTSVGNTLQYVVINDQHIKLYPNPTTLFARWLVAQSDSSGIPDISFTKADPDTTDSSSKLTEILLPVIKSLLPSVLDMTKNGIPLEIKKTDTTLEVFMNTELIVNLLQLVATAINENPEVVSSLLGMASEDAAIADLLMELQKLLPQIDAVLKASTKIEIGLSFNKYAQ